MTFADKLRKYREDNNLTQTQLAEMLGLNRRSIASYESDNVIPRAAMLKKIAELMQVPVEYLTNDEMEAPCTDDTVAGYIEQARKMYGPTGAKEADELFEANVALFAGGTLSQEQKDKYFEALMRVFVTCKEESLRLKNKE